VVFGHDVDAGADGVVEMGDGFLEGGSLRYAAGDHGAARYVNEVFV